MLGLLGIQNGDRIESIDGQGVGDDRIAQTVFEQLRERPPHEVVINRRSEAIKLLYFTRE